jgi:hypothetical protein
MVVYWGREGLIVARQTNEQRRATRRPAWTTTFDHGDNVPQRSRDLQKSNGTTRIRPAALTIYQSLSAFCSIVSLTAANISRILVASVACVRLKEIARGVINAELRRGDEGTYCG